MKPKPAKYRIGHAGYVSEFDQFLDTFLARHPDVGQDQRRGWYIWWDQQVDLKEWERQRQDAVPAKSYQYE